MEHFLRNIIYGARQLRQNLVVAALVVFSAAIGVGACTAVFNWIDTVVFDPLPAVPHSRELVTVVTRTASGDYLDSSYLDYEKWRDENRTLSGIAVFQERSLGLDSGGSRRRVWAMGVSGNFFSVLNLQAASGRFFLPEDAADVSGGASVAVISHDFWISQFKGDPSIIGRPVRLNQRDLVVIGVAPKDFKGTVVGLSFDVWVPLRTLDSLLGGDGEWLSDRKSRGLHAIARLRPGASLASAQSDLDAISARLAQQYPDENAGAGAYLFPLDKTPYGAQNVLSKLLNVLMIASLAVLLIVSANIANILLIRASDRKKEIGVRMALGASRGHIFRQMLSESLIVSLLAAAVSIALAWLMSGLLRYFVPATDLPVSLSPGLGPKAFVFALGLALVAGLATALLPAVQGTRVRVGETLKENSRGASGSRAKRRLRGLLAIAEIALAFVAVTGAVLCIRTFAAVDRIDPGFDSERVLLVSLSANEPGHSSEELGAFYAHAAERLRALPGVRAVGYAEHVPLGLKGGSWEELSVEGYAPGTEENMKIYRNYVDEGYFDVMGIKRLEGRGFHGDDNAAADPVAIVNEAFAKRYFAGRSAIGRRIQGWGKELTVVGVVKDSKYASRTEGVQPYLYVPYAQFASASSEAVLHVAAGTATPEMLQSVARDEVNRLGSLGYVAWVMPLRNYIGAGSFKYKMAAVLLGVLGIISLILAALGIYGVISHSVKQRTGEIGIRMALGASAPSILGLIVGQALRIALLGVAAGVIVALLISRLLAGLLYGVSAIDPLSYLSVAVVLIAVAVMSSFVPAFRASRIQPIQALRMN